MIAVRDRLRPLCLAAALMLVPGCDDGGVNGGAEDDPPQPIQIGEENTVIVRQDTIVSGPIVSGELTAERRATVRAELGGSMTEVQVDEGESVRRGTVLGRIEAPTLDDARRSAESAVRAAEAQLSVARRETARTEQLVMAGALAVRDLEIARSNVTAAEASLADARSRLVSAQKQLTDTVVRAPLTGVVSARAVSTGDVVTPGAELFTIVDPTSMQLVASVPSDDLGRLRVGLTVRFTVRGFDQTFEGRIDRISPVADPMTRQVPIFVRVPNPDGRLVSGLYAEGRVVEQSAVGLVVDEGAVVMGGEAPAVLRVRNNQTERVEVTIGVRDPRTERVQLTSGVSAGDVLLRGPAQGLAPGTRVTLGGAMR